jgi:threonine dehydratase
MGSSFTRSATTRSWPATATIGLEILEDLPDVDAVVIPFGGGGLSCGIASALRALRPSTKVFAAEVATSAPLGASLAKGEATEIEQTRTFVDGIGGPRVFPEMFALAQELLDGALISSLDEVAARCACWSNAIASWRRARVRLPSPRLLPVVPERARSSASSPAGTSTQRC